MTGEMQCSAFFWSPSERCSLLLNHSGQHRARSREGPEVSWVGQHPDPELLRREVQRIMKILDEAGYDLVPRLVGLNVAEARALVGEAGAETGLSFNLEMIPFGRPVFTDYCCGRIRAFVRDGKVVGATVG